VTDARAVVDRYLRAFESGDASQFGDCVAEDVVAYAPDGSVAISGLDAWKRAIASEPFRDERIRVDDLLVDGAKVCVRYTLTCVHESGVPIRTSGTKIYTVREGKIAEIAGHDDVLGVLRQLGITELPA
jgi:ketosteroid isomerase-like protein